MDLVLMTTGVKARFFCEYCEEDGEDPYENVAIWDTCMDGAPYCSLCDHKMELDVLLVPASLNPQTDQI